MSEPTEKSVDQANRAAKKMASSLYWIGAHSKEGPSGEHVQNSRRDAMRAAVEVARLVPRQLEMISSLGAPEPVTFLSDSYQSFHEAAYRIASLFLLRHLPGVEAPPWDQHFEEIVRGKRDWRLFEEGLKKECNRTLASLRKRASDTTPEAQRLPPDRSTTRSREITITFVTEKVALIESPALAKPVHVRGESCVRLFRIVTSQPDQPHGWRDIQAVWNADRDPHEVARGKWKKPPEVDTLKRSGRRIKKSLAVLQIYWQQDVAGSEWRPPRD